MLHTLDDAVCSVGTWCEFQVSWTADTISLVVTGDNGDEFAASADFEPDDYTAGPLLVGAGRVVGAAYFAELQQWGATTPTAMPTAEPWDQISARPPTWNGFCNSGNDLSYSYEVDGEHAVGVHDATGKDSIQFMLEAADFTLDPATPGSVHLSLYSSDEELNVKPRAYINLFNASNGVMIEWNLLNDLDLYTTDVKELDSGDCESFDQVKIELLHKMKDGVCALGTWCELDISWDDTSFYITVTSEGDAYTLDQMFTPSDYSPGPLIIGSGYVYGDLWFADMEQEGAIDQPSAPPTVAPTVPSPTSSPTSVPTLAPSRVPVPIPTTAPGDPSAPPTYQPSPAPSTPAPIPAPTDVPTAVPVPVPTPKPTPVPSSAFRSLPASEAHWADFCTGGDAGELEMSYSYYYDGKQCMGESGGEGDDSVMFFIESTSFYADPSSPGSVKASFFTTDDTLNTKPIFYLNLFGTGDNGITVVWKLAAKKQRLHLYDTKQPNSAGEACADFSDMILENLGSTSASCEPGMWCQFVVSWDASTITVTGVDGEGGEYTFSEDFKPSAHETGPLMLGAGYIYGDAWFANVEEEGCVPAPTSAPTATVSPTVSPTATPARHGRHTPKPSIWNGGGHEYSFSS